tara:strand:+ start:3527 stop:3697 length:171 start_codon:yes stop_codon:yes gene_type:complete
MNFESFIFCDRIIGKFMKISFSYLKDSLYGGYYFRPPILDFPDLKYLKVKKWFKPP